MRVGLAALCVTLSFAAPNLPGQTIAGLVVRGAGSTPAGRTVVVLVDDSAQVVSRTQADSTGIFYADAPAPGRYRVVFFPAGGSSFISPPSSSTPASTSSTTSPRISTAAKLPRSYRRLSTSAFRAIRPVAT